jgi:hypothetical protein
MSSSLHRQSSSQRLQLRALALCGCLVTSGTVALLSLEVHAQGDLRSSFPGRRIGGGTRGLCSSRLLAHLVPASSVFSPGKTGYLGILEGPSTSPSPLEVTFRPLRGQATVDGAKSAAQRLVLPASAPGITLFTLPMAKAPTVWESAYLCPGTPTKAAQGDPLNFVATESPPARSLLVQDATRDDAAVQAALQKLRQACGSTVPRAEVGASFGLTDLITSQWPERIPVRFPA